MRDSPDESGWVAGLVFFFLVGVSQLNRDIARFLQAGKWPFVCRTTARPV
jgi:hypothetical protein